MTFDFVRDTILDELKAKGYAPNPADVHAAVVSIMAEHTKDIEVAAGDSVSEAKKLASAGSPLIQMPTAK
jgi:hypothetical protein